MKKTASDKRNPLRGLDRLSEKLRSLPATPGVYLMKDARRRVIYIGKAKSLRSRVNSYFQPSAKLSHTRSPAIKQMVARVADVDWIEAQSEVDALLMENRLIKDTQPRYNQRLTDGKTYPYLEIRTREDFPRVSITRTPRRKGATLFGPFVSNRGLRGALELLQCSFKFRTCELDISHRDDARRFFRPCILHAISRCSAPCADRIDRQTYRADVRRLLAFLRCRHSLALKRLKKEMADASAEQQYENAARIRDQIRAIEALAKRGNAADDLQPEAFFVDPTDGLRQLQTILDCPQTIRTIEGIDIAHLSGADTVGSVVCFVDGKPFKTGYRRFRIKNADTLDDYDCLREIISRRYRRGGAGEELYPDVILIDGGPGQLSAAQDVFENLTARPAHVLALAKKEELIHLAGRLAPIRLARNAPALRLCQAIRDEAHRFAQHYHHILRRKRTLTQR